MGSSRICIYALVLVPRTQQRQRLHLHPHRMPEYKRPESVIVLVHSRCNQVLMLSRLAPDDFWQSVTGSLEPGESPQAAAVRELREETGIKVPDQGILVDHQKSVVYPIVPPWLSRYAPGVTSNREHQFSVEVPIDEPVKINPAEHVAWRWLSFAEAATLTGSASNRDFINSFHNDILEKAQQQNS